MPKNVFNACQQKYNTSCKTIKIMIKYVYITISFTIFIIKTYNLKSYNSCLHKILWDFEIF